MGQRIDQILDLAGKNKAQAIQEALRLRKWLEQQQTTGQAEVDRQAVLEEIKLLIDLIRKS
jgi:hypothetical protein